MTVLSKRSVLSPRARTNLILLWAGQFISCIGDQFFSIAGSLLVFTLAAQEGHGGASAKTGLMGALRAAPALLFGLFGGVLADRVDRRRLMIAADLARAALFLGVWHAWHWGVLAWWMLPLAAFLCYSFSVAFEPARNALIPQLAAGAPLLAVNSIFQTSMQAAFMLGGLAVGLLGLTDTPSPSKASAGPLALLVSLDGVTFVVSALFLLAIRDAALQRPPLHRPTTAAADIKQVVLLAWRDPRLRALLLLTAVDNLFIMGPSTVGAALLFQRDRGTGFAEYAWFGLALSGGFLLGAAWVVRWGKKLGNGMRVLTGMVLGGATYLPFVLFSQRTPLWVLLVAIFVHGTFIPWITVARTSIVQSHYPAELHGRIFACIGLTVTGSMSISAALTGIAGEWLSAPWLLFCAGAGGTTVGIVGLTCFRSIRTTP